MASSSGNNNRHDHHDYDVNAVPLSDDPFDIPQPKHASLPLLKQWKREALVLNPSRQFRYTLDSKREEEKAQGRRMITSPARDIRASALFKLAGENQNGPTETSSTPTNDYAIGLEQLVSMTWDNNISVLQEYGGVECVSQFLKTNLEKGVTGDETDLLNRRKSFGSNTYPQKKGRNFLRFLWEACQDVTVIILIIAAVVLLPLGMKTEGVKEGWSDGGSIAIAVFLVIIVTAVSDYRQSLQFQNLNDAKHYIKVEVIRGGRTVKVSIFDIVVGDVVPLKIGDQVPADGIVITSHSLAIDESSMTGKREIVHKDQQAPFLMAGCKVADGFGTMLVTGVGINTKWGLFMAGISEDTGEETPLQVRLNGLTTCIGLVGIRVAGFMGVVLLVRYSFGFTKNANETVKTSASMIVDGVIKILISAVAIVVVAVPEGLPLAVNMILAYSMQKMVADKALVRRRSSCETMGFATTICSDKTGILTLNQMTVAEVYVGRRRINNLQDNSSWLNSVGYSLLIDGIAQNTTGNVIVLENVVDEDSGSPMEKAILNWGVKLGMKFDKVRSESTILHVFPFNSEKMRGGVVIEKNVTEDTYYSGIDVHCKGAAEIVLSSCIEYFDSEGSRHPIEGEDKDPCRPGVQGAVSLCKEAGVKVTMVTGDHLQTAKAIARECGILASDEDVTEFTIIEGRVFRALSTERREQIAKNIMVMGRASPNDKLLLVQALRKVGEVVAAMGDGTNGGRALLEADIGLSKGICGTEVAQESSDIIILDDNFTSVVKVVRWGRSVYTNIQRVIQFQLTVNFAALGIDVLAVLVSADFPLNAVQLLWVNLIMDIFGALALSTEPPTDHLMHRSPVGRREVLISNIMWRNLVIQAVYQVIVLLVLDFWGTSILQLNPDNSKYAVDLKNTLIFNAFVLCQIFNMFNARKPDEINVFSGVTKNHLFMGIIGITFLLQIIIIEFLGKFTTTVKLNWKQWLISIGIAFFSWPLAVVGKFIPVPTTPFAKYFIRLVQQSCANA